MQPDLGIPLSKASNGGFRIAKETRRFDLNGLQDRDEKPVLTCHTMRHEAFPTGPPKSVKRF
jgi:hypothetical protein